MLWKKMMLIVIMLGMCGCGQTGKLYLPENAPIIAPA